LLQLERNIGRGAIVNYFYGAYLSGALLNDPNETIDAAFALAERGMAPNQILVGCMTNSYQHA